MPAPGRRPRLCQTTLANPHCPPARVPDLLARNARATGVELDDTAWAAMDEDERYALIKLGDNEKPSHNFAAALEEFMASDRLEAK